MDDMRHQIVNVRESILTENIAEAGKAVCGQVVIFPGSGKKIAEQLLRIQKQIGPVALGTVTSPAWKVCFSPLISNVPLSE